MKSVDLETFDIMSQKWFDPQYPDLTSPIGRHFNSGDKRLSVLRFHPSKGALMLWNFLLTEEERLARARQEGDKIVGTMKDLGTLPVLIYAFDNMRAFYPDGAWWLPCFKAMTTDLFAIAERYGMGEGMCPVRAMLGAFESCKHFPIPDILLSSSGAVCDDFSAISQRLHEMGHPIHFWEMPHVRRALPDEESVTLVDGRIIPKLLVDLVEEQFHIILDKCEQLAHCRLSMERLHTEIRRANRIRATLDQLREAVYAAPYARLGALEMMISEMLIIHYCSDRDMCEMILNQLLDEVNATPLDRTVKPQPKLFWVNPVADLRAMNLLESCNAMLGGTDFMFTHALSPISEDLPPLRALALAALTDTMCSTVRARGEEILRGVKRFGAQGIVMSRIPGASHCAYETDRLRDAFSQLNIPMVDIEVQSVFDSFMPASLTRLEALCEMIDNP